MEPLGESVVHSCQCTLRHLWYMRTLLCYKRTDEHTKKRILTLICMKSIFHVSFRRFISWFKSSLSSAQHYRQFTLRVSKIMLSVAEFVFCILIFLWKSTDCCTLSHEMYWGLLMSACWTQPLNVTLKGPWGISRLTMGTCVICMTPVSATYC
jgi:hypothetical protein